MGVLKDEYFNIVTQIHSTAHAREICGVTAYDRRSEPSHGQECRIFFAMTSNAANMISVFVSNKIAEMRSATTPTAACGLHCPALMPRRQAAKRRRSVHRHCFPASAENSVYT